MSEIVMTAPRSGPIWNAIKKWLSLSLAKRDLYTKEQLFDMPCHACGAPHSAEQWMHGVCADFHTAGTWAPVCVECDIALNEHHLRFFFGSERDADLEFYAEHKRRTANPQHGSGR